MMADGGGSWWYGLIILLGLAVGLWMAARVLRKAGLSPWWALLMVVPVVNIAAIWLFAFSPWPRIDRVRVTPPSDYDGGWDIPEGRDKDKP